MIYIVLDKSHESGDYYVGSTIIFLSSDIDSAQSFFEKYCSNPSDDEKWVYEYELPEFPDGYNYYSDLKKPKVLRHSDNLND